MSEQRSRHEFYFLRLTVVIIAPVLEDERPSEFSFSSNPEACGWSFQVCLINWPSLTFSSL